MSEVLSLFSLAQAAVANILWGKCNLFDEASLSIHRTDSEKKIQKLNVPASISLSIKQGLSLLQHSCHDAFDWLKSMQKIPCLECLNVYMHDENYHLRKFMLPLGEFNDVKWVMQFIDDPTQDLCSRFCFAVIYCLKQRIILLWKVIENNNYYVKKELLKYPHMYHGGIFKAWIFYVDRGLPQSEKRLLFKRCFQACVLFGYEKAVLYIWNLMTPQERNILVGEDYLIRFYLRVPAVHGYPKCVYAFYSCLCPEKQLMVFKENFQILPNKTIWQYFLEPVLVRFIPDQIALLQNSLPEITYTEFLYHLACKIKETKNYVYQELFYTFWKFGSAENKTYFLDKDENTFLELCKAEDFDNASCILKDALHEQKRRFLLKSLEHLMTGDTCFGNDPSIISKYLGIFINDFRGMKSFNSRTPFYTNSLILLEEIRSKCTKNFNVLYVVESLISEIRIFP